MSARGRRPGRGAGGGGGRSEGGGRPAVTPGPPDTRDARNTRNARDARNARDTNDSPGAAPAPDAPSASRAPTAPAERFADLVADARRLGGDPRARTDAARRRTGVGARKPAAAASSGDDAPGPSFRWPDPGDRHRAASTGVSDQQLIRLGRGEPEAEERIDLHGTRVAEAKRLVAQRIASARARGLRCVLLVHGRGRGSATNDAPLRDAVPDWLTRGETGRSVLAFAPAPRHEGGEGATRVLLRKRESEG